MKRYLIIGASPNQWRYSHIAVSRLRQRGFEVIALGVQKGSIEDLPIINDTSEVSDNIHTVSIYLRKELQIEYYSFLLDLKPQRIIFNPGSENSELQRMAQEKGIEVMNACMLVMISTSSI